MGCNCLTLEQASQAQNYVRCLQQSLGVPVMAKWNDAAHAALYAAASRQVAVLSERHEDGPTIAAVPFGAEPSIAAAYAMRYGDWQQPDSQFWTCLGITKADADAQRQAGFGPYWDTLRAAATHISGTEAGPGERMLGVPWWGWLLIAAAVGGAVYVVAKD